MSKGEQTREMILARAAQIFNCQGYSGSSLADIMDETGLKKGGIYNHFSSKDQLALEAFDYAVGLVRQRAQLALAGTTNAIERLLAVIMVFQGLVEDPPLMGGCPILNTAIEADDAHPVLREHTRKAMDSWRETIHRIVQKGIEREEIRSEVDADALATLLIATLEGAIMLSKLYGDAVHMHRAVAHLTNHINIAVRL